MRSLQTYLAGVSFSSLAMGIQVVLLPWLAVGVLSVDAEQVGWVQASVLLPSLLLLLVGGAYADGTDGGRRLPQLLIALGLVHGLMLWVILSDWLSLYALLFYGGMLGICQAFLQPLRDSMLPRVVKPGDSDDLQRSVIKISLCYFAFQGLGIYVAGQQHTLEISVLLVIQVLGVSLAAYCYSRLPKSSPPSETVQDQQLGERLGSGVRSLMAIPLLRQMIALVAFNGFMHMGVFIVVIPLLVRDVYGLGANYFAGLQLAFVVGNVVANMGLLRRGAVQYPGRSVLFCVFYTGVLLLAIGAKPTLTGLLFLVFCWGCVTGVASSLGKSIVQQLAPAAQRGRVMSIYQLALFGMAPLGALACGYAVDYWGGLQVLFASGIISAVLFVATFMLPGLWQLQQASLQDSH